MRRREGKEGPSGRELAAAVQPSRLHPPTPCPAAAVGGQDQRNPPGLRIRYRELLYDGLRGFTLRGINNPGAKWAELTCE